MPKPPFPPGSKRSSALKVVRRTLATGEVREYRYQRRPPKQRQRWAPDAIGPMMLAYRASPEWASLKPQTKAVYTTYLKEIEALADTRAADITRRMILALRDAIARTRGNGAATGFIRAASAFFGWLVSREYLEHSPVNRIKPLPGNHLPQWTEQEAAHATNNLPEPYRRVVMLALYTGQRRGDLCRMPWSAYDGKTIQVRQEKTGAKLTIPVHKTLRSELNSWRKNAVSPVILTAGSGRPWAPQHLSHMLPIALRRIGLRRNLNVHGLRKLAAARIAEAGGSTHEIAAITGHRSLSMVQLYTAEADQKRLADSAIARLENEPSGKRGKRRVRR